MTTLRVNTLEMALSNVIDAPVVKCTGISVFCQWFLIFISIQNLSKKFVHVKYIRYPYLFKAIIIFILLFFYASSYNQFFCAKTAFVHFPLILLLLFFVSFNGVQETVLILSCVDLLDLLYLMSSSSYEIGEIVRVVLALE